MKIGFDVRSPRLSIKEHPWINPFNLNSKDQHVIKDQFRFDGRCGTHPRYNPEKDGRPQHKDCPGCDALWVIHLYTSIARRKAESGEGILVLRPDAPSDSAHQPPLPDESFRPSSEDQGDESPDHDTASAD